MSEEEKIILEEKNAERKAQDIPEVPAEPENLDDSAVKDIEIKESNESLQREFNMPTDKSNKYKFKWIKSKPFIFLSSFVVILVLIFSIPLTRYSILGIFLKVKYSLNVVDNQTGSPVIGADVLIKGKHYTTNSQGSINASVNIGNQNITISKKYYASLTNKILVPFNQKSQKVIKLTATGRMVPIKIVNKINKKPVANILITADGVSAKTDNNGNASIVLSANNTSAKGIISGQGYNNQNVTIYINGGGMFDIVPSGSIYYLSNSSGTVDVVKSSLDGANRSTVLIGNSSMGIYNTNLYPSSDWAYIALVANRNNQKPCLTIIRTSNDSPSIIDQTNGNYIVYGWDSNNTLIYSVQNTNVPAGTSGEYSLKSYNPLSNSVSTIDSSASATNNGITVGETFNAVTMLPNNTLIYSKVWTGNINGFSGLQINIVSVNDNNTGKKTLQQFDQSQYSQLVSSHYSGANSFLLWIYQYNNNAASYFQYIDGKLNPIANNNPLTNGVFNYSMSYPVSADGTKVAYSSNVNGHNAIYVANSDGSSPKQLALLGNSYNAYSWVNNDYIIINNNNNEFFIMPATGTTLQPDLIKISDHL
jgi:hypothetical protein